MGHGGRGWRLGRQGASRGWVINGRKRVGSRLLKINCIAVIFVGIVVFYDSVNVIV